MSVDDECWIETVDDEDCSGGVGGVVYEVRRPRRVYAVLPVGCVLVDRLAPHESTLVARTRRQSSGSRALRLAWPLPLGARADDSSTTASPDDDAAPSWGSPTVEQEIERDVAQNTTDRTSETSLARGSFDFNLATHRRSVSDRQVVGLLWNSQRNDAAAGVAFSSVLRDVLAVAKWDYVGGYTIRDVRFFINTTVRRWSLLEMLKNDSFVRPRVCLKMKCQLGPFCRQRRQLAPAFSSQLGASRLPVKVGSTAASATRERYLATPDSGSTRVDKMNVKRPPKLDKRERLTCLELDTLNRERLRPRTRACIVLLRDVKQMETKWRGQYVLFA